MAYSDGDLQREADALVESCLSKGAIGNPAWLTEAIIGKHPLPDEFTGEHRQYTEVCRYGHTRDAVRRAVNRFKAKEGLQDDRQLTLPGYDHLQRGYLVEREGEQVLVPTELLTDAELEMKALEYERMAEGCRAHAKELRQFVRERRVAAE